MDIVLRLRELRRMRNLTQKEAALSAGVGEKTISSFETGDRIMAMKLGQFLALLGAYDTTPEKFFGNRVERSVFAEFEALTEDEATLLETLRGQSEEARAHLLRQFSSLIAAVESLTKPRLRAIR